MAKCDMYGKVKKIHMVGIGGTGMCGIAEILLDDGYQVSGSDLVSSPTTERLARLGARVFTGHKAEHIAGADVVVTSSAVRDENVEVLEARARLIPVIRRAEMLAELMRMKFGIAVAGTHGKTTTTSMIGLVLEQAGLDPTVVVGGRLRSLGRHAKRGASELFVAEADEFDRSFLRLSPSIAVITNIDTDHLDCYGCLDEIIEAFIQFANKVPFYGTVVACIDDRPLVSIIPRIERRILTYGESAQADLLVTNITYLEGGTESTVKYLGKKLGQLRLQIPGQYNIENALASVVLGLEFGVPFKKIAAALAEFTGVHRRCEIKGEVSGRMIIDDYAHHPTEIKATLEAIKKGWTRRIVAVFQPHLYSRTRDLATQFGSSFFQCDILVVTEVYGAREKPIEGVSGQMVADSARDHGHRRVIFHPDKETLAESLAELSKPGDIVVTLGAGDINRAGEKLLEILGREGN